MLNKIFQTVILGVFILGLSTTTTSCKKETDTIAIVIVKNTNGTVISGATVVLYPDQTNSPISGELPNASLTKTNKTDANGKVEFTYDLECVLNIEATKLDGNDELQGNNVIQLLKGKTTTKVVEIN